MPSAVVVALFATEPRRQRASRPPRPRPGTSSSAPSVATEAAALDEEDLSPWWWTHRPAPSAAIGEPFEHDSRSASGAGGRPAGGAALESAPGTRGSCPTIQAAHHPTGIRSLWRAPGPVRAAVRHRVRRPAPPSPLQCNSARNWSVPSHRRLRGLDGRALFPRGQRVLERLAGSLERDHGRGGVDPGGPRTYPCARRTSSRTPDGER